MGAPKGNQFWKLRSKHGRDKLFATPELMWEAACEYFQWCVDNPWVKAEKTKRAGSEDEKTAPTARPFTMSGLCLYLNADRKYFSDFKLRLTEKDKDFLTVITRIEEIVYTQKFEGAAVGAYNPNIIARDLGLADKRELSGGIEVRKAKELERRAAELVDEAGA